MEYKGVPVSFDEVTFVKTCYYEAIFSYQGNKYLVLWRRSQ